MAQLPPCGKWEGTWGGKQLQAYVQVFRRLLVCKPCTSSCERHVKGFYIGGGRPLSWMVNYQFLVNGKP